MTLTGKWRPIGLSTGRLGEAMLSERIIVGREAIEYRLPGTSWFGAIFGMRHLPGDDRGRECLARCRAPVPMHAVPVLPLCTDQVAQDIMKRKRSRMLAANDRRKARPRRCSQAADQLRLGRLGDGRLLAFAAGVRLVDAGAERCGHRRLGDLANAGQWWRAKGIALEAALFDGARECAAATETRLHLLAEHERDGAAAWLSGRRRAWILGRAGRAVPNYRGNPTAIISMSATWAIHSFCGRTGSGKTTLIAFLVAQAERLGATVV